MNSGKQFFLVKPYYLENVFKQMQFMEYFTCRENIKPFYPTVLCTNQNFLCAVKLFPSKQKNYIFFCFIQTMGIISLPSDNRDDGHKYFHQNSSYLYKVIH